jgi:dipeptidyl aminopeptidase/acylaminoacyl peptidase
MDLPVYAEMRAARIQLERDVAYVSAQVGGDVRYYRVALTGPEHIEQLSEGAGSKYLFAHSAGRALYLATSSLDPPELMLGSRRVTNLNVDLMSGLRRPRLRSFDVTASDGLQTEAWALTPSTGQGPWPTVLYIHGGPYAAFGSTFMIDFQLLVGAGFAVVFHNFRGSIGYGDEFAELIVGQWGPAGSLDHHAALDEAIRIGITDPDRIGVCGYSHGGFATCWLVGTSHRFRAAVAETPSTSFASAFGNADADWWLEQEFGGTPTELPEAYFRSSPLSYATNCTTPLLFVVGEEDLRCHPVESEQYYRVLKSKGVPTEMLRLPGSSHIGTWNGPVASRIAQNEALLDWFTRYLAPKERSEVPDGG